ncbi:MAG: hypothetical protein EAX86_12905 [Candidatus Heimdallarchaeota archaeon]|nr:hypothetical protein [Candidatus Heimdallarchaeota archaeon]
MNDKRRFIDDIWGFNFDNFFRSFEEEFNQLRGSNSSKYVEGEPITYGYSVKIGPETNYQPEVRQWGNINDFRSQKGLPPVENPFMNFSTPQLESREFQQDNTVDFINEEENLSIIVELPGFTKQDLNIEVTEDGTQIHLTGKADRGKELNKSINLPSRIIPKSTKSSIKNGVLEIRAKKETEKKTKKFKVDIE